MAKRAQLVSLITLLAVGGCASEPAEVVPDSELMVALKSVKSEWLEPCTGLGDLPGFGVGNLLQDFADAATLGALCRERHNSFIEYIGPVIKRAQSQSPP